MSKTWPDGTPKSTDNAFNWKTGNPSIFMQDPYWNKSLQASLVSSENVRRARSSDNDRTILWGLSKKADELVTGYRRKQISINKRTDEDIDKTRKILKGGL